ncbi:hypothetical protein [Coxiella-like endosymbiont]|uniref:hypothetical protein n=1 Tax=Coxiella-like endosymbiont TaxID=1592897 RepID=UPI00215ABF75|nr:hypothetical protein [Coxiella-like endosymbiont]UVE59490.1 hypothetical protein LG660_04040 [Coxiella-like endosymbiont]
MTERYLFASSRGYKRDGGAIETGFIILEKTEKVKSKMTIGALVGYVAYSKEKLHRVIYQISF